ncbi:hypothetical protein [Bacillus sp. AFS031507]|uniref:hypothetical protein n=1 Tax=Bacillus sp. AFS031507 TaxID=2033496 RepID=UPI000BFC4564|nr:hypothetical protein [Bacillus sp. AFS031507]PGY11115.1 hypothetical protein COE25_11375 [Bacillus sp. AFS031507]
MKISDFDQLKRVSKFGGVYILWDIEDNPIYVGYASIFGDRLPKHYNYLKPLVHSISIYPTNEHRLLEYTLIQRVNPIKNRYRDWNRITRGQYGSEPYLLSEKSYWGYKFFKKGCLPFTLNSKEDHIYIEGVDRLIKELERLRK